MNIVTTKKTPQNALSFVIPAHYLIIFILVHISYP